MAGGLTEQKERGGVGRAGTAWGEARQWPDHRGHSEFKLVLKVVLTIMHVRCLAQCLLMISTYSYSVVVVLMLFNKKYCFPFKATHISINHNSQDIETT